MSYILVILLGYPAQSSGVSMSSISAFSELALCQSAGEAWKVHAKEEVRPRYYCIPSQHR